VLGTVFARRTEAVHRLHAGDTLILVPDPPDTDDPAVWVHAPGGDVVGHLPFEIGARLQPWMLEGGRVAAGGREGRQRRRRELEAADRARRVPRRLTGPAGRRAVRARRVRGRRVRRTPRSGATSGRPGVAPRTA
jgi:hypothetical protein